MNEVICSTVVSVLDEMELRYSHEGELFTLTMCEEEANFPIRIIADDEQSVLTTIGYFPVKISRMNIDKMYKVINDLNYRQIIGSFVIDSEDGELSYRISQNADDGAINEAIVRICLCQVIARLKNTYEDVMKAMYGGPQMNFTFGDSSITGRDETKYRS